MQSLYEKDKLFALQYIAAENRSKITYRSPIDEGQRTRQHKIVDNKASYGPPDKSEHFAVSDDDDFDAATTSKEVEVLYSDGVWYRGWLGDYNFETGKWVELMHFYEDNETTEVNFPNDEVRVATELELANCRSNFSSLSYIILV